MKVAVNLTWLAPGRVGGSEEYLTRQLAGIDDDELAVELFVDRGFVAAHPELADRFAVRTNPIRHGGRAGRIIAEHSWLAAGARTFDVVHHGGGTAPLFGRPPLVLTVHDLQYRTFPEYFSTGRRRYLQAMVPRSVRRAAVTAVPSEFVRGEIVEAFDVDPDRVVVVPHGVPDVPTPTADRIDAVRRQWGLDGRAFVVYPAITHPHKAHTMLVDMVDHLDGDTALVLPGGAGAGEAALMRAIGRSPSSDRIVRTGRVSAADRDALIAGADALVFPSEFEGFGAPVVEAMAFDTPVVTSDAQALVEVVGSAGIVVNDTSPSAWAAAVDAARSRRGELVVAGRVRRDRYTVAASSSALIAAYRRAAS